MYFINICSSAAHLSRSSNPIPGGSRRNKQHHMWRLLFLHGILNRGCSLCCVLLHITLIRVRAHTVILRTMSTRSHSGTSRPHCAPLMDANLRPSWRSGSVLVGESETGKNADMRSLGSLPNALCSQLQFGQVALAP